MQRRRFKHILTFPDRLENEAKALEEKAREMPPGIEREIVLRKARQVETALRINEWLSSPGLRSPK
jgi:hypothetical protein